VPIARAGDGSPDLTGFETGNYFITLAGTYTAFFGLENPAGVSMVIID
jgi:hypothetical protein